MSGTTAVGLNFPLLKAYFADGGRCQWVEPAEDNGRIYSRLLTSPRVDKSLGEASGHKPEAPAREALSLALRACVRRPLLAAHLVEDVLGDVDRHLGGDGQGDGVAGPAVYFDHLAV